MKYLGENDDIDVFEDILSEIYYNGDLTVIKELCSVFVDDIDFPSASESIMKTILYICKKCGIDDGMNELVNNIDRMFPQSRNCAVKLIRMILNNELYTKSFINVLNRVESNKKDQIVNILKEIKDCDCEKYKEKVDLVLKSAATF
jgi:hypothetical protein